MRPETEKRRESSDKGYVNKEVDEDRIIAGIEKLEAWEEIDNEQERNYKNLDRVIEQYSKKPGQLIRILHKAQDIFGYLSEEVQGYIAEKTGIPVSEVNGVVTFYSLFSTRPKGKYIFRICMGTACYIKGAQGIMNTFKEHLKIDEGETTRDKLFTLKTARCVGACGLAPVLLVNEEVHGETEAKDIVRIIQKYRKGEKIENTKH